MCLLLGFKCQNWFGKFHSIVIFHSKMLTNRLAFVRTVEVEDDLIIPINDAKQLKYSVYLLQLN